MKIRRLLISAAILLAFVTAARSQEPIDLSETHERLVLLLEGEPVVAKGSAVLCAVLGHGPQIVAATRKSYFGEGGCDVMMKPEPGAVSTRITTGAAEPFHDSPALRLQLVTLLSAIEDHVSHRPLRPEQRLVVQSTALEITNSLINSLNLNPNSEWRETIGPLICRSLGLLRRTGYTPSARSELAAADIPDPLLAERLAELSAASSGFVEVVPPSDLHANVLLGRFTARIFFSIRGFSQKELLAELRGASRDRLYELPLVYPDLRAVLVLYFNVVTPELQIVPTGRVAEWREYSFTGRTSYENSLEASIGLVNFKVIESYWRHDVDGPSIAYKMEGLDAIKRRTFPGVKPGVPGTRVTTLRAYCAGCHLYRMGTMARKSMRLGELETPFSRPEADFLTQSIRRYERQLADWDRECRGRQ